MSLNVDQGILTGPAIVESMIAGDINISPFDIKEDVARINPNSIDLTLGSSVAVYRNCTNSDFSCRDFDTANGSPGIPGERLEKVPFDPYYDIGYLDSRTPNPIVKYELDDRGIVLLPGIGYLMHTAERVHTDKYVPVVDGKSSIGRLFCVIHETAGYIDTGFDGQYTLEVVVVHPLIVYPGMRFCQVRFHTVRGDIVNYKDKGSYVDEFASGVCESRSWNMFK